MNTAELWNKDHALRRMMGKESLLQRVVALFLEQFPEQWQALSEDLDQGDLAGVQRRAHTLKGSAGELALPALQQCLGAIEQAARHGDHPATSYAFEQSRQVADNTLSRLQQD